VSRSILSHSICHQGPGREAVEAERIVASDALPGVGRERIDECPRALKAFGVLPKQLVTADHETVGDVAQPAPARQPFRRCLPLNLGRHFRST